MLVVTWDAMYEAIPRLQAKEQLAAYTVAVTASPYLSEEAQSARDGILDGWRDLLAGGKQWLQQQLRGPSGFGGPNTPEGAKRDDGWFPPLRAVANKMSEILGSGFRE